ncbi:MAG: inositol monophosphatase [Bacteroidetes bacterium]|nr:MAG: inositol monophosphatase [Bacteroidota bacterium]
MNYSEICEATIEVVKLAAGFVRERHENRRGLNIETKGRQNFVTEIDKAAEEILVKGLSRVLPEAGFVTEEGTSRKRGERFNWVVDPIDGTTNFIHGVFPFAISVGLAEGEDVVLGVVYEFGLDECFYAWKGGGAWCNGKAIKCSRAPGVNDALIATGFPYTNFSRLEEFKESMDYFMANSHGLRRLGSAATDIAYVACGRYDAFYEYGLHAWDIAAGMILMREAGGEISDFKGQRSALYSDTILCAGPACYDEFQKIVEKIMMPDEAA